MHIDALSPKLTVRGANLVLLQPRGGSNGGKIERVLKKFFF